MNSQLSKPRRGRRELPAQSLESRVLFSTYFVSNAGSDVNPGTIDLPFQSLVQAVATVQAGDEIILRAGTYAGGVTINDANVTVRSADGERASIVTPTNDLDVTDSVRLYAPGCRLLNLEISGGSFYAVKLEGEFGFGSVFATDTLIQGCILHDSGRDVVKLVAGTHRVTIVGNEIYNSGVRDPSNAEGIDNTQADDMIARDNYVHDIATTGIYAKGGAARCVIERNRVERCGDAGILLGFFTDAEFFDPANTQYYESRDSVMRNNVIIDTGFAGIGLWAALRPVVYNNTVIRAASKGQAGLLIAPGDVDVNGTSVAAPTRDAVIANNVITMAPGNDLAFQIRVVNGDPGLAGSFDIRNNRYFGPNGAPARFDDDRLGFFGTLAEWRDASALEAGSTEGDPGVDSTGRPTAGSPLIDTGRPLDGVLLDDLDGHVRPFAGGYDIGAFEFGSTELAPTPSPTPTPGPTSGSLSGGLFHDANGNGVIDAREPAQKRKTVYLDLNRNGALDGNEPTTVTGRTGIFGFENLAPGDYAVRAVAFAKFQQFLGTEATVTLGQETIGADVAVAKAATIRGKVLGDTNGDGRKSRGERPAVGVTVFVDVGNNGILDAGEAFVLTDARGAFTFAGLAPGSQVVRIVPTSGQSISAPVGASFTVSLASGKKSAKLQFAVTPIG